MSTQRATNASIVVTVPYSIKFELNSYCNYYWIIRVTYAPYFLRLWWVECFSLSCNNMVALFELVTMNNNNDDATSTIRP